MSFFQLRGKLSRSQSWMLGLAGFVLLIIFWWVLAEVSAIQRPVVDIETRLPSSILPDSSGAVINLDSLSRADSIKFANATEFVKVYPILPPPQKVVGSYPDLIQKDELVYNSFRSIWLNFQGYFWAILISVPIGFIIGLYPLFRGLFSKQVDAMRFLPLTALTGLFIRWFGIEDQMKIAFLAFGIIVYLLPVVVQRIDEVRDVYIKTVFTLGAKDWQTIRTVFIPSVWAKIMDDIRVLTAISWTYIIIAELLNRKGGIGSLIYIKARQGQIEKVFAILIVIIIIGFLQDRIFVYLDRRLFPHKYYKTEINGIREVEYGLFIILGTTLILLLAGVIFPGIASSLTTFALIIIGAGLLLTLFGEYKTQMTLQKVKG